MLIQTEGIVLKQRKIANNRRLITLFTKDYGKITAGTNINERGKGRAALALRPFTFADYDLFKGGNSFNINNADVRKSFFSIGEDIDRYLVASKLLSYLDAILPEEGMRHRLFELTLDFMESITKANGNFETLLYAFVIKSLAFQGVNPELKHCVNCGKPIADIRKESAGLVKFFSVSAGGILCEECALKLGQTRDSLIFRPSFDIVEVLDYFTKKPLSQFEKVSLKPQVSKELQNITSEYVKFYLDVDVFDDKLKL